MEDARDFCRDLGRSVNGPVVGEACGDADDKDDELMESSFRFDGDGLALDGLGVPGFTSTTSGLGRDTLRASALAALPASAPSFCISSNCSSAVRGNSAGNLQPHQRGAIVQEESLQKQSEADFIDGLWFDTTQTWGKTAQNRYSSGFNSKIGQ